MFKRKRKISIDKFNSEGYPLSPKEIEIEEWREEQARKIRLAKEKQAKREYIYSLFAEDKILTTDKEKSVKATVELEELRKKYFEKYSKPNKWLKFTNYLDKNNLTELTLGISGFIIAIIPSYLRNYKEIEEYLLKLQEIKEYLLKLLNIN